MVFHFARERDLIPLPDARRDCVQEELLMPVRAVVNRTSRAKRVVFICSRVFDCRGKFWLIL